MKGLNGIGDRSVVFRETGDCNVVVSLPNDRKRNEISILDLHISGESYNGTTYNTVMILGRGCRMTEVYLQQRGFCGKVLPHRVTLGSSVETA